MTQLQAIRQIISIFIKLGKDIDEIQDKDLGALIETVRDESIQKLYEKDDFYTMPVTPDQKALLNDLWYEWWEDGTELYSYDGWFWFKIQENDRKTDTQPDEETDGREQSEQ